MDIAQFRLDFPEFTSTVRYPDSQITFWATVAEKMVRSCVWKDMYATGVKLYVAHEITLAAQNAATATNGGFPGSAPSGITNSKTVGNVSVGYDTQSTVEKNAGWWNLTIYGRQFYRLTQLFGAGAIQL